jgi:SAM-dependent methyltransferase
MTIESSKTPADFMAFEQTGWDQAIDAYETAFGPVSRQTLEPLLDAAGVLAGMRILDVCTGPGMLVEAALARGAEAVGLDFSEAVVSLARRRVPAGAFRQADAQHLPFADARFDAALCAYGVMHLPVPELALREMVRVVRSGGRVAISVWDSTTPNNGFGMVYAAIRAHGNLNVPLPHGPDFFQFSSPKQMRAALTEVGLSEVQTTFVAQHWHVDSAAHMLEVMRTGTVRARALLAAQNEADLLKIQQFLDDILSTLKGAGGGFDVPLPALIGSGVR